MGATRFDGTRVNFKQSEKMCVKMCVVSIPPKAKLIPDILYMRNKLVFESISLGLFCVKMSKLLDERS
jgi:hypothetical protein